LPTVLLLLLIVLQTLINVYLLLATLYDSIMTKLVTLDFATLALLAVVKNTFGVK